ncbi:MAG: membrane metalloprotease [Bacteroidota bacterium]
MRLLKILGLCLLLNISGCSKDDDFSDIENGINKSPNLKSTGASANGFLSASKYTSLVIEVLYVENFRPESQTLLNLKQFAESRLNKPNGISIIERQISVSAATTRTLQNLADIEKTNRTKYNNTGVLTLYILFIDGNYTSDTSSQFTLGAAYRNTSIVMFENSIRSLSNSVTEPARVDLETTTITHELCHLLGLVKLGSPMQTPHEDTAHEKHCINPNCLMYWKAENNSVSQMMTSGNVPQLDADCLADLFANGGK